jgi:hypothetical protein
MDFIWDYYGIGIANYATLNVAPDQIITYSVNVTWLAVSINQVSKVVIIYPTGKNDSVQRSGTVTLSCPDAPDIDISVVHFAIPIPDAPVATAGTSILETSFYANWQLSTVADGYYLDVAEDVGFVTIVAGFNNLNVGAVLTKQVTGLTGETDYWFRVRGYNDSGTSGNSNTIKVTTGIEYTISLSFYQLFFDYLKVPCTTDTITVTSSHNWTAAWISGSEHFTADKYAGTTGQTITISCKYENDEPDDHAGVLRVTCGNQTEYLTITQYQVLQLCV